jgi:RNA polymerase sigma factor (sigma-70 family)
MSQALSIRGDITAARERTGLRSDRKHAFVTSIQRSHGQRLRRFMSARVRNAAADTPDLVQEVYLRLLRIADHETIRNPQAYLFTVASHVLHQHALRQSKTLESIDPVNIASELHSDPQTDPVAAVEAEQAFEEIGRSLQKVSPRAYETLILNRCEGLTLAEIGQRLGVSRDQVKKYLARALIHVRKGLDEMERGKL